MRNIYFSTSFARSLAIRFPVSDIVNQNDRREDIEEKLESKFFLFK